MNRWKFAFTLVGVGWFVALTIVLGAVVGIWLDKKFHTTPILALVGVTLGLALAMYGVWRMLRPGMGNRGKRL